MLEARAQQENMKHLDALYAQFERFRFADFKKNPKPGIDRYGATNPAEFLAVLSEVFFERPQDLYDAYPHIYQLFTDFFRQNPL